VRSPSIGSSLGPTSIKDQKPGSADGGRVKSVDITHLIQLWKDMPQMEENGLKYFFFFF
jgi:hypothetical protein